MKRSHPLTAAFGLAALAFLYLPLVAVVIFSVNSAKFGFQWQGFSLKWYAQLFQNDTILELTRNTLFLAVVSTLIATVLGTALALGLERYPWGRRLRGTLETALYLPVVTPDIILAAALVVIFGVLQQISSIFEPGMLTMIIGHVTFQVAFVCLTVQSRLASLGRDLEEAAYDLYASYPDMLRRVLLPLLAPGIAAGAMLAFTLSLDDFIISLFTSGPSSQTLPLYIYASVKRGISPEIHALSSLMLFATLALVLGSERLTRRKTP